jgi:hypothetical protein
MRAEVEAINARPDPEGPVAQTLRLAAREEPRSVAEAQAIEAELAMIARRRAAAVDPAEIAALEGRARELRRLNAAEQAGEVRP